jgi:hypothetical protein
MKRPLETFERGKEQLLTNPGFQRWSAWAENDEPEAGLTNSDFDFGYQLALAGAGIDLIRSVGVQLEMTVDTYPHSSPVAQVEALPRTSENIPNISQKWDFALAVQVVDFLSGYGVEGILQGFTPGEITVSLGERVSEYRIVTVHLDSFTFEGEILYCGQRDTRFEAHISLDDAAKTGLRRSPRFPVRLPGRLFPPDASPVALTIIDISRDGLGVQLPVPLEAGQPVAIATESIFIFAVVRHCFRTPEGSFRAGCEMHHLFERPVQSSANVAVPGLLHRIWEKRLVPKKGYAWLKV